MAFTAAVFGDRAGGRRARGHPSCGQRSWSAGCRWALQRRAAFAQALSHEPDLLILDEPTSGVDPLGRARLWETIADAADGGAGVLVTTHYMEEAGSAAGLS